MMLAKKIFGDSAKPAYRCQCMVLHAILISQYDPSISMDLKWNLYQLMRLKPFFPFEYTFTVIFHFLELSLQISLVLENEGRETIPWSSGLHPYFQIPWRKDLSLKDHQIRLDAKKIYQYKEGGIMEKNTSTKEISPLDDPSLINRVYYELKNPSAEISLLNNEEPIKISEVGGSENGSRLTFVSWTKKDKPFFCLEPWMSPPNACENKTTRMVPPGEETNLQ